VFFLSVVHVTRMRVFAFIRLWGEFWSLCNYVCIVVGLFHR